MKADVNEIMRDVRIALDQNRRSDALVETEDIDTLSLDEIIKSKIEEGVRRVHTIAPIYLLEQGHNFGGDSDYDCEAAGTEADTNANAVYWKGGDSGTDTAGYVLLPTDYLRLVKFAMSDWERPVYSAISVDDPEYARQSSRFAGVRGTAQKPVCALVVRPEGLALEFYSCKSRAATIGEAVYIPRTTIDDDGKIDLSERCYTAIIYMIASLVLYALNDAQTANIFAELSKSELGL